MSYRSILVPQLRIDEGVKYRPYRDSVGKLTIGVGRNLDDVGLNDAEVAFLLNTDIEEAEDTARSLLPSFDALSDVRKAVLVNMAFNLGHQRLAGFKRFLKALAEARYSDAADEMLDSTWAKQVGDRAKRLADNMRGE